MLPAMRSCLAGLLLCLAAQLPAADGPAGVVWKLEITGAIGPATSDHVVRGMREAVAADAVAVVLLIDTPGGLDGAMRDIIQAILASPIPVLSYVTPQGARAASAGTYILYASQVAAMTPATNLGAATPVQLGMPAPPVSPRPEGEEEPVPGATAMEKKMVNDATAYIKSLAELRGRNVEWAETAVREGASLAATEALELGVIDFIAESVADLLEQADGVRVTTAAGEQVLQTAGADDVLLAEDWRTAFLKVITNPNLVLLLGIIGFYALVIEFYGAGGGLAGISGAIALLLAAYGLQMLPVNFAGLGLILLGLGLILAEVLSPSFGVLGAGGIIAFVLGGVLLVDTEIQAFQVGIPVLAAAVVMTVAFLGFTGLLMVRMRRRKVVMGGSDLLVGATGVALHDFSSRGQVRVGAEIWKAETDTPVMLGDRVRVVEVDGLALSVTPSGPTAEAPEPDGGTPA